MKSYANNYNVRDDKGRFVAKSTYVTATPILTTQTSLNTTKEDYLKILREKDVFVEYEKNGILYINFVSLQPKYFPLYVGKGTSKKVNNDILIVFDIDAERFRVIEISKITSFNPL